MNLEQEIKLRFPNINIENWKIGNWLLFNGRRCRLNSELNITFIINGIAQHIYIYQFRFGYFISGSLGLQLSMFLKNSERYKIFQIIAAHERLSTNQKFNTNI